MTTPNQPRPSSAPTGRMDTLDGMRGMAALGVVAYHMLARWAEPHFVETLYPHGDRLAGFFPLQVAGGWGVLLFFLISGFVIMMTLERSNGIIDFTGRRVGRLWPTMLFCATASTLLINGGHVIQYYEHVDRWHVTALEYFSSIFFLPPDQIGGLLGIEQADRPRFVEGVYWTLWAEVRFYALIAIVFLLTPVRHFLWAWVGVQAASTALGIVEAANLQALVPGWTPLSMLLQPNLLCWFTLGLVAWKWQTGERGHALWILVVLAVIALNFDRLIMPDGMALIMQPGWLQSLAVYIAVITPFALFLSGSRLLAPLRWRPMITIGLASYPLYLFHERPGMLYLAWAREAGIHPWVGLGLAIVVIIATALLIHRFIEEPAKKAVVSAWKPLARRVESRYPQLRFQPA